MQIEKDRQALNPGGPRNCSEAPAAKSVHKQEQEAIRRAQKGDLKGFEQIYRLHSKRVYGQCFRMLANAAEAEDLTQEVFLQVFRKIKTFRGSALLSTWLYRLTINAVLMHIRRKNSAVLSIEQVAYPQPASCLSGEESLSSDQWNADLADRLYLEVEISQLPWTWRLVFLLHDVHGYKHSEIARMMRCSINTSKGLLRKAHMRLRSALLQSHGGLGFSLGPAVKPC